MKSAGRMHSISGMTIFTGTFMARSSACWRRLSRNSEDWTRRTWAIGMPYPLLWGVLAALLRFVPYAGPGLAFALMDGLWDWYREERYRPAPGLRLRAQKGEPDA